MNYQRIVQWVAGPFSMIVGVAATKLTEHLGFLGSVGLSHNSAAHAIVVAVTFGVTTLVTYAAHHKWLSNLAEWWHVSGVTLPATSTAGPSAPIVPVDSSTASGSRVEALRKQITDAGMTPSA